jgi:hypothetical protein
MIFASVSTVRPGEFYTMNNKAPAGSCGVRRKLEGKRPRAAFAVSMRNGSRAGFEPATKRLTEGCLRNSLQQPATGCCAEALAMQGNRRCEVLQRGHLILPRSRTFSIRWRQSGRGVAYLGRVEGERIRQLGACVMSAQPLIPRRAIPRPNIYVRPITLPTASRWHLIRACRISPPPCLA